jgi:hypothetical protein
VIAFCKCQKIGAEEEGVLSKSGQLSRMRHPSNSSCHPRPDDNRADVLDADSGRTSVHLSINSFRGSTLSTSSGIARTISQEEASFRGRISRHLIFVPQQTSRTVKQHQLKAEAGHVSTVESKVIG